MLMVWCVALMSEGVSPSVRTLGGRRRRKGPGSGSKAATTTAASPGQEGVQLQLHGLLELGFRLELVARSAGNRRERAAALAHHLQCVCVRERESVGPVGGAPAQPQGHGAHAPCPWGLAAAGPAHERATSAAGRRGAATRPRGARRPRPQPQQCARQPGGCPMRHGRPARQRGARPPPRLRPGRPRPGPAQPAWPSSPGGPCPQDGDGQHPHTHNTHTHTHTRLPQAHLANHLLGMHWSNTLSG